jgi:hypothetical protein
VSLGEPSSTERREVPVVTTGRLSRPGDERCSNDSLTVPAR